MRRETSQEIDAVAAEWAARIDREPLSAEEEDRLEAWLAEDDRRYGAFMRMRAISLHSERAAALGPDFDPGMFAGSDQSDGVQAAEPQPVPLFSRRKILWGTGAAAAAACAAGIVGLQFALRETLYETGLGQTRIVTLDDGSVITLNTASRLKVRYGKAQRLVSLEEGEALFDVAKDKARPFIVQAGGTAVRAVGTSFTVKRLAAAPVEVLVREGVVEVTRPAAPTPVRMAANTRMTATDTAARIQPVSIAPEDVARELAWKSGRIALEGETLAQAAASFARYSDTRIVIDDPDVAREEISGLFAANDPVSFARAAALSLDLKAQVGSGEVRLSR